MTRIVPTTALVTTLAIVASGTFGTAQADVVLKFANDRDDASTVPAYVTFGGTAPFKATATIGGVSQPVQFGKSYLMSDLANGVTVSNYNSGRVFISLGAGLTNTVKGDDADKVFTPNYASSASDQKDFQTRYDKFEITVGPTGNTGGANLSSTDFLGLPLQLSDSSRTLTWDSLIRTNNQYSFNLVTWVLAALANYRQITPGGDNLGSVVLGAPGDKTGIAIPGPGGNNLNVVRIISPTSTNQPATGSYTPYLGFKPYLTYLQTGGPANTPIEALIQGHNGQFGTDKAWQNYDMRAFISNSEQKVDGVDIHVGDIVLTGTVELAGKSTTLTLIVRALDINDRDIYGAVYKAGTKLEIHGLNENGVVDKIMGDYMAMLNYGLVGSTVDYPTNCPNSPLDGRPTCNPSLNGKKLGELSSGLLFGTPMGGDNTYAALSPQYMYGYAQPTKPFYNLYAGFIENRNMAASDSYGFPFNDRASNPLIPLTSTSELKMTILNDNYFSRTCDPGSTLPCSDSSPFVLPFDIPAPAPLGLLAFASLALTGVRLRGGRA